MSNLIPYLVCLPGRSKRLHFLPRNRFETFTKCFSNISLFLLKKEGYIGETLGERLKSVPREKMQSLTSAWEAHKIRNEIAHAGSDFILTQREARSAIDNYRRVFEEFHLL